MLPTIVIGAQATHIQHYLARLRPLLIDLQQHTAAAEDETAEHRRERRRGSVLALVALLAFLAVLALLLLWAAANGGIAEP